MNTTLGTERFVSVTSFERNGTPVSVPVWCAGDDRSLLVFSEADSWKVKRIRRDPHVRVAPCSARGKPRGPAIDADATIVEDTSAVEALLAQKYGRVWTAYTRAMVAVRWLKHQAKPASVTIRIRASRRSLALLTGPRLVFLNYATENLKPLLQGFKYVGAAPQEPSFGLLLFQVVGKRSMTRPLPMRNGLDFDPVAEFSRFGVQSVDAERSIVGHRARE